MQHVGAKILQHYSDYSSGPYLTAFFFAQLTIVFTNSGPDRIIYSLVQMLYNASATRGRIDRLNR